jgi:hypothetical protein
MQHSDFEIPTEGTGTGKARKLGSDAIAAQAIAALERGDYETAGRLLEDSEERFPDDSRLRRLATRQRKQADRFAQVYTLLKEAHEAIDEDRFAQALGAFREAANLSQGFAGLEEAAFNVALEECEHLGARNWRVAAALLEDAGRLNSKLLVPPGLWNEVRAAEREENIANTLAETALAKPGELKHARERLLKMLGRYPQDSGLCSRLRSIEATIEEKRKWDERQRYLKKLTDLRDALQSVEEPAEAGRFVRLSEALAADYGADAEFSSVVEDIRQQVISAEKAAVALQQNRIDDCLEECAWVLSRMRHHRLFLRLKEKAEKRELAIVDEYSKAVARVKDLLGAGQVVEAERLCAQASARLPQVEELHELARQIERRKSEQKKESREKIDSADRLVERAERSLRGHQFRAAEQLFGNALKLLPDDKVLADHVAQVLHDYARSTAKGNPALAVEVMELAERILPGTAVAGDLSELLVPQREKAKAEEIRWSALGRIEDLRGELRLAQKREQIGALKAELEKDNFANSEHADVKEAAAMLSRKIDARLAALDQRSARQATIRGVVSIAAALLLVAGLTFWLKTRGIEMVRPKPAAVQVVRLTKPSPEVNPSATLASVEIHGDERYTQIKLDGILVAGVGKNQILTQELPPGKHSIELLSQGYLPKTIRRKWAAGEKLVLTRQDLKLESSDARTVAAHKAVLKNLKEKPSWATVQSVVARDAKASPQPPQQTTAEPPRAAQTVDKGKQEPDNVLLARADENEWNGTDRSNKAALEDFLRKHPGGPHATAAASALNELERKAAAAETQHAEEAAWKQVSQRDAAALESYLREYPAGRYRDQAELALATVRHSQAAKTETAAVLTVISRFAHAWTQKDLDSILSIQRTLNRRVVKAELSQVKELEMQISPASAPQIDGSQAVVLCRRQAMQVFSDGTRKQIPDAIVSYVLEKHDGAWTIEETR